MVSLTGSGHPCCYTPARTASANERTSSSGPISSTPSKFQIKALSAQTPTQIRVAPLHGESRTTKARSVSTHNAARYRHLGFDASHGKTWSTKHGECDPVVCRWRPVSHRSSADQAWSPDFLPDFALLGGRFYAEQEQHAVHRFRHEKTGVQHRPTRYPVLEFAIAGRVASEPNLPPVRRHHQGVLNPRYRKPAYYCLNTDLPR